MSTDLTSDNKIRARYSHMGLVVKDIDMIVDFYTRVIGFERTDTRNRAELIVLKGETST